MKINVEAEVVSGNRHNVEKGIYAYNVQIIQQKEKSPQASGSLNVFAKKGEMNLGDVVPLTIEVGKVKA